MGFDQGHIILDSFNGAYYTGQTIFGRLVFDQDESKTIHGICVDFKGFCKVHWTSSQIRQVNNNCNISYALNHDSYEEYIRSKTYVFGDANGEHHLQPGHHEFRFDCPIPKNSPSSFEGSHGHVRYRIKIVMLTTGISSNNEKVVAVKVFAPVNLNHIPYCKEPIEFQLISSYGCISVGSSEVHVKLPKGGYCPGQVIPMEVTCRNPSTVEINEIKFAIMKDVAYSATSERGIHLKQDTVAEIKKGPIPAGTRRNWTVEMEVPAMDIYDLKACRFIDIFYHFKVSTEVSGCRDGTEETRVIVFGNVPLVGFQDNVQNPLHDQMPKITVQNVQGANTCPPPPIISQPLPNLPYPNDNGPYPNQPSPYPANPGYPAPVGPNPPYPGNQPLPNMSPFPPNPYPGSNPANSPYSPSNVPYPAGNAPYPAGNLHYPTGNLPYPTGNSPHPAGNPPYPAGNAPYPTNTPYSTDNSPHDGNQSPVPPYPAGQSPVPPKPSVMGTTPLKTGIIGFLITNSGDPASVPLLPPGANVPYPTMSVLNNPYATASAPEPSTPDSEQKKAVDCTLEATLSSPYNPDFKT